MCHRIGAGHCEQSREGGVRVVRRGGVSCASLAAGGKDHRCVVDGDVLHARFPFPVPPVRRDSGRWFLHGVGVSRAGTHRAPAAQAEMPREKRKRKRNPDGHVKGVWPSLRQACVGAREHRGPTSCKGETEPWIFERRRRFRYRGMTCDTALAIRPDRR